MAPEDFEMENNHPKTMGGRDYLGFMLVLFGVSIAFWVFVSVYGLFTAPEKLSPFQELVSHNLETWISSSEKESLKIVVPAEILSYLVPLFLLLIASGIAGVLITGGCRLLDSDVQRVSRKITTLGYKLHTKLDHIQDTLHKHP